MTHEELRAMMGFLMGRVHLAHGAAEGEVTIGFDPPSTEEIIAAGLSEDGWGEISNAPWWDEMVTDIVETPEMCDPGDASEQILGFAKDVVAEYIRKRANL